jgi:hypothetical protein
MDESIIVNTLHSPPARSLAVPPPRNLPRRRINPVWYAFAQLTADFFLVGAAAILAGLTGIRQDLVLNGGGVAPSALLILAFATLAVMVSLYCHGAYPADGNGPRFSAIAAAWLDAAGLITVAMLILDVARGTSAHRPQGIIGPTSLLGFIAIGSLFVLGRVALQAAFRPCLDPVLTKTGAVVVGAGNNLSDFIGALWQEEIATLMGVNLPLAGYLCECGLPLPAMTPSAENIVWQASFIDRWHVGSSAIPANAVVVDAFWRRDDPLPAIVHYPCEFVARLPNLAIALAKGLVRSGYSLEHWGWQLRKSK